MHDFLSSIAIDFSIAPFFMIVILLAIAANVSCFIGTRSKSRNALYFPYGLLIIFFISVSLFIAIIANIVLALAVLIPATIIVTYAIKYSNTSKSD